MRTHIIPTVLQTLLQNNPEDFKATFSKKFRGPRAHLLQQYEENKKIAVWELGGNEIKNVINMVKLLTQITQDPVKAAFLPTDGNQLAT